MVTPAILQLAAARSPASVSRPSPAEVGSAELVAEIGFLAPGVEQPFVYGHDQLPGEPAATAEFVNRQVRIREVRGARRLSLDANGATLLNAPTAVRAFDTDEVIERRYYPECAEIMRAALGARRVIVYDHNIRRGDGLALHPNQYRRGRPVQHAHTDYTAASAARRLREVLGAAAPAASRDRFLQINLWRPIRAPLRDAPLAICDAASLTPGSLRATELRYRDRRGEIYYLVYEPCQRWYYAADMGTDEAWLLKNFDSDAPRVALAAPHSAFEHPAPRAPVPPRESIEVRAFAFL